MKSLVELEMSEYIRINLYNNNIEKTMNAVNKALGMT